VNEQMAKELVVRAGIALVESGLIARTWGNVSCRVDENTFVITPSGRSYETLKPDEIVLCRIDDASYEGTIKPSSEKGIHALLYQTHSDTNFVIHTHQLMASVISATGLERMPSFGFALLGKDVPIAEYGLPGTKKLREGVRKALTKCDGHTIIMSHHGALCFGENYDETFSAAQQLEDACRAFLRKLYLETSHTTVFNEAALQRFYISTVLGEKISLPEKALCIYNSRRTPDGFVLEAENETVYHFTDSSFSEAALIHCEIYKSRKDINYICQDAGGELFAVSLAKAALRPLLDDFAQIVGSSARNAQSTQPHHIVQALRGHLGVLVPGGGALCCAATQSDTQAVRLVMEKDALAQIGTQLLGGKHELSLFDCLLMHFVYTKSYSKKAHTIPAAV
jgi:L-ribulose-5-phosphate 4-epimerase